MPPTVNGRALGENLAGAECWNDDVIRDPTHPVVPLSRGKTLAVLRGNLAPDRRGDEVVGGGPEIPEACRSGHRFRQSRRDEPDD